MIEFNEDIYPQSVALRLQPVLTECADGLRDLAKIGSKVLEWDAITEHKSNIDSDAVWLSLRTIIELVDATSVLVRNSSIEPAKLQLRVLTEVVFGLEWILKDKTGRMSLCFLYKCALQDLKAVKKLDLSLPSNKELVDFLKMDQLTGHSIPSVDQAVVSNIVAQLDRQIASARFDRVRSNHSYLNDNQNAWYSAFDGPKDIRELSKSLRRTAFYYSIYDRYSRSVHGTPSYGKFFSPGEDNQLMIRQINLPDSVTTVVQQTFTIALVALKLTVENRIPNRRGEFENFYGLIHYFFLERLSQLEVKSV